MTIHNLTVDEWENTFKFEEPPLPPLALPADPVACACASYRVWKEAPSRRWEDITTVVVWQDDIEEAERLKKYYRERMVIEALKSPNGVSRSSFRQKLAKLVVDELTVTKKEIGLLMRLPYFYEEDQALDEIQTQVDSDRVAGQMVSMLNGDLVPLKRILVSRRAGDYLHYWFTDTNNTPYNLVIKQDNPLVTLFNGLYQRPVLRVHANLYPKTMRGYRNCRYYQLAALELA